MTALVRAARRILRVPAAILPAISCRCLSAALLLGRSRLLCGGNTEHLRSGEKLKEKKKKNHQYDGNPDEPATKRR